jgi:hypothetical protein
MIDLCTWQKNNDAYLSAALKWLRIKLSLLAKPETQLPGPDAKALVPAESLAEECPKAKRKAPAEVRRPRSNDPIDIDSIAEDSIAAALEEMATAGKMDPPPALLILGQRLGLSRFEREVLLLCAAVELDTNIPFLCAHAQHHPDKLYPTFALALSLFDEPAWDALSPQHPLRHLRLIEIAQTGAMPLTASPLLADERIVSYIKGLNYIDERLSALLTPVKLHDVAMPPSQRHTANAILDLMLLNAGAKHIPIIQLTGLDSGSKELIAGHVCTSFGLQLYRLPVETLPQQPVELETFARLWERDSLLLPLALYLDARQADPASPADDVPQPITPLGRFLTRSSGLFIVDTRDVWPGLGETALFEVSTPTPGEQQATWQQALGIAAGGAPAMLAGQFNLNVTTIQRIAHCAQAENPVNEHALHDRIWQLCLSATRPRLELLAQRIQSKVGWDDIVLPADTVSLLHKIADQVRQRMKVYEEWGFNQKMSRGLGINALFAGDSGTGKTMAAEVISKDLGLDLYRIDLSAVVSKYIGETEKNLRRLFDAAEDGGAILFFDEADALFGKRSEVKDSHDRYANIEINYLLQRMESYRGLAILATNLKCTLDQAFMRRLRFIVNFQFPGVAERKLIWQKVFPSLTPLAGLNAERLARLNLTGGAIGNIALNAAFLAAGSQSSRVTMPLVLDAARTEFRKLEKAIDEAAFRAMGTETAQ